MGQRPAVRGGHFDDRVRVLVEQDLCKLVRLRGFYAPGFKLRGRKIPSVERDDIVRLGVDRGRQNVAITWIGEREVLDSILVACDLSSRKRPRSSAHGYAGGSPR